MLGITFHLSPVNLHFCERKKVVKQKTKILYIYIFFPSKIVKSKSRTPLNPWQHIFLVENFGYNRLGEIGNYFIRHPHTVTLTPTESNCYIEQIHIVISLLDILLIIDTKFTTTKKHIQIASMWHVSVETPQIGIHITEKSN